MRAKTIADDLKAQVDAAITALEAATEGNQEGVAALDQIKTFAAVAFRIIAKTNPSKVRDAAMTEWIRGLMDGEKEI